MGKNIAVGDDVVELLNRYRRQLILEIKEVHRHTGTIQALPEDYRHLTDEYLIKILLRKEVGY